MPRVRRHAEPESDLGEEAQVKEEDTTVLPAVKDPVYQAITQQRKALAEPKKSLADLGLGKVTFTYLENGALRTWTGTVQSEVIPAVLSLLLNGEIG